MMGKFIRDSGGVLGHALQGGRLPFRLDEPAPEGADDRHAGRGAGGGSRHLLLRRGLAAQRRFGRRAHRAVLAGEHGGHRHRHLQRSNARPPARPLPFRRRRPHAHPRRPRRQPGRLSIGAELRRDRASGQRRRLYDGPAGERQLCLRPRRLNPVGSVQPRRRAARRRADRHGRSRCAWRAKPTRWCSSAKACRSSTWARTCCARSRSAATATTPAIGSTLWTSPARPTIGTSACRPKVCRMR